LWGNIAKNFNRKDLKNFSNHEEHGEKIIFALRLGVLASWREIIN
jgi:hypothetical protein